MQAPLTVLLVDDQALVRMETAEELADRGFIVLEAGSAAEALVILAEHPEVSVMMTDVDMPGGMDGLRLAAAVSDRWPPIRIIVVSGHMRVTAADLPSGGRFFDKPFRVDDVALAMREMTS